MKQSTVAVVGAGLAGLTAAYRLQQAGLEVKVFESTPNLGGRSQTVRKAGYIIDTGASAIAESYFAYRALLDELGMSGLLHPASPIVGIARDGTIHELDMSSLYRAAFSTKLLSLGSKLRLCAAFFDVWRAKRKGQLAYTDLERAAPLDYETAHQYSMRRLNEELAEYFCDPIVRAMQLADAEKISKVEFFSGLANIFEVKLYGLEGGVVRMAERLAAKLEVRTQCPVSRVLPIADGVEVRWLENRQERSERFDACTGVRSSKRS